MIRWLKNAAWRARRWLKSYVAWARIWLGIATAHAHPFRKCIDCGKPMWRSAHLDCIPF